MITLERDGDVFVLNLGDGDNRFNADTVAALNTALDEVAATTGPAALVTAATGKIWSNGLDLDYMGGIDDPMAFVSTVHRLIGRFMTLPMPTVAALQGHAFAGGAMMSFAHDVRIMRVDRGYLCLPEIDLGMPFGEAFSALNAAKLPQPALHRLAVLGERIGASTALALGVVDQTAELEDVLPSALSLAHDLAPKAKPVIATIRHDYYGDAIRALVESGQSGT